MLKRIAQRRPGLLQLLMTQAQLEFEFTPGRGKVLLQRLRDYGVGLAFVAVGWALRLCVEAGADVRGGRFLVFFIAVVLAAHWLRLSAGVLTIVAGIVAATWLLPEPETSVPHSPGPDWINGGLFLVAGFLMLWVAGRWRHTIERMRCARAELQAKAAELNASEEFNRRMLSSSADCITVLDLEGRLLSINEGCKRLRGLDTVRLLLRRPWANLWRPEAHGAVAEAIEQALRSGIGKFQTNTLTPAGEPRWWDVVITPILGQEGRPERLLAISRDVTETRMVQEALKTSEDRLQMAVAATDDAVWDADLVNGTMSLNDNFHRQYGSPPQGDPWEWRKSRMHPADRGRVTESFEQALNGSEKHWAAEYRMRHADGQWDYVLDRAMIARDETGRARRVVGAMMDLTPLRKANRRAELLAETSYRLLLSESPLSLIDDLCAKVMDFLECDLFLNFLVDAEKGELRLNACGGVTTADRARFERLGLGETVCGRAARDAHRLVIENVADNRDPQTALIRELKVDAYACHPLLARDAVLGTLSFGTRSRRAFDEGDLSLMKAVAGLVAIALERQRTEAELRAANEELEQRVRERTKSLQETTEQLNAFCHSVAHDLRSPLRTQIAYARLVLEDHSDGLDATGRDYLRRVALAAERQASLIHDLMAHVNLTRAELPLEPLAMAATVETARADLELEMQERAAVIETQGLDSCRVLAHRSSLHLVLLNLLSNACKFVAPGVRPYVRVRGEHRRQFVRLWVEDNGIGIPQPDCERIFLMFQRLHRDEKYSGNGMGLALVRKAVERMGGRVGVESEPGRGSRFWVELPAVSEVGAN